MTRGDQVIHLDQPMQHGLGCVVDVTNTGTLTVQWADLDAGDYYAHELEHAERWEKRQLAGLERGLAELTGADS